jgi:DNA mismatch endonuclease (patch repair protein)
MPDKLTIAARSALMAKVQSIGNLTTEIRLSKLLRCYKITGWRRNQNIFGRPDFLFRRNQLAIFVDGCFWHGCPKCYRRPRSNKQFWDEKVARNKARDRRVNRELRKLGWCVMRIWEHELAQSGNICIRRIQTQLEQLRTSSVPCCKL